MQQALQNLTERRESKNRWHVWRWVTFLKPPERAFLELLCPVLRATEIHRFQWDLGVPAGWCHQFLVPQHLPFRRQHLVARTAPRAGQGQPLPERRQSRGAGLQTSLKRGRLFQVKASSEEWWFTTHFIFTCSDRSLSKT